MVEVRELTTNEAIAKAMKTDAQHCHLLEVAVRNNPPNRQIQFLNLIMQHIWSNMEGKQIICC